MTIDEMFQELAGLAADIVDAGDDPERVPARRQLVLEPVGRGNPSEQALQAKIASEYQADDASAILREKLAALEDHEYWGATQLLANLQSAHDRFQQAAENDHVWHAYQAYQECVHILTRMYRQLEREALDDGGDAEQFVVRQLHEASDEDLAELLSVGEDYVVALRNETERAQRLAGPDDPPRTSLIAQLVFELRETATTKAIVEWFSYPVPEFDDDTPLELIDRLGLHEADPLLRDLAQRGRAQIAT